MTLENAKVAKSGKGLFFKLKWQQKTFWPRKNSQAWSMLHYFFHETTNKLQTWNFVFIFQKKWITL